MSEILASFTGVAVKIVRLWVLKLSIVESMSARMVSKLNEVLSESLRCDPILLHSLLRNGCTAVYSSSSGLQLW